MRQPERRKLTDEEREGEESEKVRASECALNKLQQFSHRAEEK